MNSPVAWALVFHIIGIVFWMGGLLTVTQVLSAHTEETAPESRQALERLEVKLMKAVAHPGAAITVLAGITVVWLQPGYLYETWLHAKLALVVILIALDLVVHFRAKAYFARQRIMSRGECKFMHGAISLVFLGIVVLVMIKPFS